MKYDFAPGDWIIQGDYGNGWEDVTSEETCAEAEHAAEEYERYNVGVRFRVVRA